MLYLELQQAIAVAKVLGFHVRDAGLLASALSRPAAGLFGEDAYGALDVKAAALFSSLAQNRPLVDGNKRFAWVMTATFLEMNGAALNIPTDEAFELVLAVAQSRLDLEQIAAELAAHTESV